MVCAPILCLAVGWLDFGRRHTKWQKVVRRFENGEIEGFVSINDVRYPNPSRGAVDHVHGSASSPL